MMVAEVETMYASGRFSGMFRVSKKLLRHYHDIGLLSPERVDPANGYYFYGQAEYEKMKLIMFLRALHMPLSDIKILAELPREQWGEGIHRQLIAIRGQRRDLARVEAELESLEKQITKGGLIDIMDKKTEYIIRTINIAEDILVIGRGARIKHGSPEHMPTIRRLIENFFGDDVPAMVPNRHEPAMRFGICAEYDPKTHEFTYMMGDQATTPAATNAASTNAAVTNAAATTAAPLPDTLRSYVIPAGDYVCVTFSAPDIETITTKALGPGYDELFSWLGSSTEWESAVHGEAYEVYDDKRFEVASWPEMDIWAPIKKTKKRCI
ncbi:MAG: MerR family transcriptional regulator [Oscillospiraceae bacterium]|nr:MerR family transcriptional regulator [Oscillospiraceae bacterium]